MGEHVESRAEQIIGYHLAMMATTSILLLFFLLLMSNGPSRTTVSTRLIQLTPEMQDAFYLLERRYVLAQYPIRGIAILCTTRILDLLHPRGTRHMVAQDSTDASLLPGSKFAADKKKRTTT